MVGKKEELSEESSSIGNNSDDDDSSDEVQSSSPLDAMDALQQVLPFRRGISRFYSGKSKSFASLTNASSIKDIAKPENAYMRKRRNLLSYTLNWDKTRSAISKRVTSSSRTTLALAVAMSSSSQSDKQAEAGECNGSLLPNDFSTWRSFSLADLQHCSAVAISTSTEMANKS